MHGMQSQEEWSVLAAASAFGGMALMFLLWWWYFDIAGAASERFVRSRSEAMRFHIWSYAHFPLYLGVVVAGVGIQRVVTAAAHSPITGGDAALMLGAAAVVTLALVVIGETFSRTAVQSTAG